mmetsp:Transcript_27440/g.72437  ORF Transcript_27440/g.72437 Transcript_27440/m.72437 type:complete len:194 (-) Transcript_27440:65-646(-)
MDNKKIKLQLLDTAGQERFKTITTAHYRNAMGILLVYDVTNEQSFRNIEEWLKNIEKHTSQPVNKILIGNKSDLASDRKVSTEAGKQLAGKPPPRKPFLDVFLRAPPVLRRSSCCRPPAEPNLTWKPPTPLAEKLNLAFFETSAKDKTMVDDAFITITRDIKKRLGDSAMPAPNPNISVGGADGAAKSDKCGC